MSKLFDKAAEAVKKRNYDYAIELFLQELTRDPNNADVRRALRAAELKKFQESGASPDGGMGARLKGAGVEATIAIQRASKNYEKAMLSCEQLLKLAPRSVSYNKTLGEVSRLAGHLEAAKVAYEAVLEADRSNEAALRSLAQIYQEQEDLGQALSYYERLRKVAPNDPEAARAVRDLAAAGTTKKVEDRKAKGDGSFRDIVKDADSTKKLEKAQHRVRTAEEAGEAIEALKAELEGGPGDARIYKQIGELCLKKKDFAGAIAAFESGLEAKDDPQVRDLLGDVRLEKLDHESQEAAAKAKKGDKAAAADVERLKGERIEAAVEEYRRRVDQRPTETDLRYHLASSLYKAKKHQEAVEHLQKATSDPKLGLQARLLLGKCFDKLGQPKLAVKELKKAYEKHGELDEVGKEIVYNLAHALERVGSKQEAVAEYERLVEVDINYKDAMKRLEALQA